MIGPGTNSFSFGIIVVITISIVNIYIVNAFDKAYYLLSAGGAVICRKISYYAIIGVIEENGMLKIFYMKIMQSYSIARVAINCPPSIHLTRKRHITNGDIIFVG